MKNRILTYLYNNRIVARIDIHFAKFIMRICKQYDPEIFLAATLVSRATQNGDICLDLNTCAKTAIFENGIHHETLVAPELKGWLQKLKRQSTCR